MKRKKKRHIGVHSVYLHTIGRYTQRRRVGEAKRRREREKRK